MGEFKWDGWEETARAGDIPGAIAEFVATYDYVSFAELARRIEPYIETRGSWCLEFHERPNIVMWAGMSEPFVDAMQELLRSGRVFVHPASMLVYLMDGGMLKMPLAKRIPKAGYKEPHWLPVTLRTVPIPERGRKTAWE